MLTVPQVGRLKAQGQPDVCVQWNSFSKSKNKDKDTHTIKKLYGKGSLPKYPFLLPFPFLPGCYEII